MTNINVKDFLHKLSDGYKLFSEDLCIIEQHIDCLKDEDNMKPFVEKVLGIIAACKTNNFKCAATHARFVQSNHQMQIKRADEILKDVIRNQVYPNKDKQVPDSQQPEGGRPLQVQHKLNEKSPNYEHVGNKPTQTDIASFPKPANNAPLPQNYQRNQKSKQASQAVRSNNPNVADLSDIHRPTQIAERFSELYDNEWTEAFEELTNKHANKEKEAIILLLDFVQTAYKMCRNEGEKQIAQIVTVIQNILESGDPNKSSTKQTNSVPNVEGQYLLVEYRKSIADKALKRLQDVLLEELFRKHHIDKKKAMTPYDRLAAYAMKCIELSWWMCVQDPPVYMCSNIDSHKDFRAYTKSGGTVDYIVWPTLKLQEGATLFKGIAQFK